MKKLIYIICVVVLCVLIIFAGVTACRSCVPSDDALINETVQKVVAALDAKDADALKNLFTGHAKTDAADLDAGISHVLASYQGASVSVKGGGAYSGGNANAIDRQKEIFCEYTVTTDSDVYYLSFYIRWSNFDTLDNGVYQLRILTQAEQDAGRALLYVLHDRVTPGVLWRGMLTADDYIAGFMTALQDQNNANKPAALFSQQARDAALDLTEQIAAAQAAFWHHTLILKAVDGSVAFRDLPAAEIIQPQETEVSAVIMATREIPVVYDNRIWDEQDAKTEYRRFLVYIVYAADGTDADKDGIHTVQIVYKADENTLYVTDDAFGVLTHGFPVPETKTEETEPEEEAGTESEENGEAGDGAASEEP